MCSELNSSVDDLTRPQGCLNLHGRRIWGSIYSCPNALNFITPVRYMDEVESEEDGSSYW